MLVGLELPNRIFWQAARSHKARPPGVSRRPICRQPASPHPPMSPPPPQSAKASASSAAPGAPPTSPPTSPSPPTSTPAHRHARRSPARRRQQPARPSGTPQHMHNLHAHATTRSRWSRMAQSSKRCLGSSPALMNTTLPISMARWGSPLRITAQPCALRLLNIFEALCLRTMVYSTSTRSLWQMVAGALEATPNAKSSRIRQEGARERRKNNHDAEQAPEV